jgi:hypothetical protein
MKCARRARKFGPHQVRGVGPDRIWHSRARIGTDRHGSALTGTEIRSPSAQGVSDRTEFRTAGTGDDLPPLAEPRHHTPICSRVPIAPCRIIPVDTRFAAPRRLLRRLRASA